MNRNPFNLTLESPSPFLSYAYAAAQSGDTGYSHERNE